MYNQAELEQYVGHEHREELATLTAGNVPKVSFKSPKVALVLSVFLGFIAIDRLYQGGIKMFLIKLAMLTLTFGTWYIADLYYCQKTVQMDNYKKLTSAVNP